MKNVFIIMLWLCLTSLLSGQEMKPQEITEFKDIFWGISCEEVEVLKKNLPQKKQENKLEVIEKFAGSEYLFYYYFENNLLVKINGLVTEEYSIIQSYFLDYDKLNLYISYFYGSTTSEQIIWQDPLWQERYDVETGILKGFAQKRSWWENETGITTIFLVKLEGSKVPGVYFSKEPPAASLDMP